ncbi:retinol dehydrogenase 11-like [Coccinella septempunctata]|uniref:retinol dehydrogenase 11-like n=1 Tax=Coccinella septempunctata TaxID=41139 RepID=UPI001D06EF43|nr:retinol dehydrogenase 11-like [Coccinella septempunctata]
MIIPYIYIRYVFYTIVFVVLPILALILLKIFQKLTLGKCRSFVCLSGKTAIVTGGASGIGFETALQLASRGCRVIIADKFSSMRAAKKITRITNNPNVLHKYLDLSSLRSVREFAKDINETEERLDILINNARAVNVGNEHTEDGLHETMQINHFGPFLLTHLLVDLLKKSAPSRIIFVSSAFAYFSNLSIENLNYPKDHPLSLFRTGLIYGNSKLCNVISANGFAKRLEDYGVTCNSLHPGWVNTKIERNPEEYGGLDGIEQVIFSPLSYIYAKTPREGAQTTLHLAMSESLENVTGKHFWDCITFPLPPGARNEKFCQDIWKESEIFVQLQDSEKLPLINPEVSQVMDSDKKKDVREKEENKENIEEELIKDENKGDGAEKEAEITKIRDKDENIDEENVEKEDGNILRFRKINDRKEFLNLNGKQEQNEAKDRS